MRMFGTPHFNLGRSHSVDNLVVPFIDILISSCGLRLLPPDRPNDVAGAAFDMMLVSSDCTALLRTSPRLLPSYGLRPFLVRCICPFGLQDSEHNAKFATSARWVVLLRSHDGL